MGTPGNTSADEFQALEQKVLRAVDVLRRERDARSAAEAESERLRGQLQHQIEAVNAAETKIGVLEQEREHVRQRVERMLQQMDELL